MLQLHYLYARSFYPDEKPQGNPKRFDYYLIQAKKHWGLMGYSARLLACAPTAMASHNDTSIVKSLADRALRSKEDWLYWKDNRGAILAQAPIETRFADHVFAAVANDTESVDEIRYGCCATSNPPIGKNTKATLPLLFLVKPGYNLLDERHTISVITCRKSLGTTSRNQTRGGWYERLPSLLLKLILRWPTLALQTQPA